MVIGNPKIVFSKNLNLALTLKYGLKLKFTYYSKPCKTDHNTHFFQIGSSFVRKLKIDYENFENC